MDLEALLRHPDPEVQARWQCLSTKEHVNVFQGSGDTEGKNVCFWIHKWEAPKGKKATHPRAAADCDQKTWAARGGRKLQLEATSQIVMVKPW